MRETINEFATVNKYGFHRFEGPFEVARQGTVWSITVPDDHDVHVEPERVIASGAAIVRDCEIVGGGVVKTVRETEDATIIGVDQYAAGDPDV